MRVSLIVARGVNGVIGVNNQLPWHLPRDLKYFKSVTLGKPIIMGRKTFESIGQPLRGRINFVLTRNTSWEAEGVRIALDLDQAIGMGSAQAEIDGEDEIMIIGGATLYNEAIKNDSIDRLYITQVNVSPVGDVFFNAPDQNRYQLLSEEKYPIENGSPAHSYQIWDRI